MPHFTVIFGHEDIAVTFLRSKEISRTDDVRIYLSHFPHVFSGASSAARYYVYMWAEVLEADAFDAFGEAGDPFHAETAERLRSHI